MRTHDLLDPLAFFISRHRLRQYYQLSDPASVFSAVREYRGRGCYETISMSQKQSEIVNLTTFIAQRNPTVVVEIGTRKGGTLFMWARCLRPMILISIDLPGGRHGGGYDRRRRKLYEMFAEDLPETQVHLIQSDSHSLQTVSAVASLLGGRKVDFLFIDGDHTYEGVKCDYELYSPMLHENGIIAFHDIMPNTTKHEDAPTIEVHRLWAMLKKKHQCGTFIQDPNQGNMGIGYIHMSSDAHP